MDAERGSGRPFFAYVALNAAHVPHVVPKEYYRQYLGKPGVNEDTAKFFGMIENIDDNFGMLLRKLDEWDISDDTLVIFLASDNGGTAGVTLFNAGMRGRKGTAWEGGTRVPCFVRWPGVIKGGTECAALSAHVDIFPTLAEITGAKLSHEVKQQVEGRSLWPLLQNPQVTWADRNLFTHVGRWKPGATPVKFGRCSVRNKQFALVREKRDWELFDLLQDPGQTQDVAARHPNVVRSLSADYDAWWESVRPCLVNEDAYLTAPKTNPFKDLYWQQFGGRPDTATAPKAK